MNPKNVPYVGAVFRFGAQDRVLDSTILLGPVVVLLVTVLGRSAVTTVLVSLYVLGFVFYVAYNGVRE